MRFFGSDPEGAMTLNMYMASVAWLCLVIGFLNWKRRRLHVIFIVCGIVIDVGLVSYLQVTRSAIQTALSFSLDPLQQIHIALSTLALIMYFPTLYFALRLLCGDEAGGTFVRYKRFVIPAFILRCLGFLFMFSMWQG
jgi:hypothetical protein